MVYSLDTLPVCSQPERCLYLTMDQPNGQSTATNIIFVADTMERRDNWLNALRQLLALRINDARYAYPNTSHFM